MTSTVIPFSMTMMDVRGIASFSEQFLDASPIRILDSLGVKTGTPKGVLCLIEAWEHKSVDLKQSENSLNHVSMGFAVHNEDERVILDLCRFIRVEQAISKEETSVILTATLADWKEVLVSMSRIIKSRTFDYTEIRKVLNCILAYLEQAGFSEIFSEYRKQSLSDSTFYLEEK